MESLCICLHDGYMQSQVRRWDTGVAFIIAQLYFFLSFLLKALTWFHQRMHKLLKQCSYSDFPDEMTFIVVLDSKVNSGENNTERTEMT